MIGCTVGNVIVIRFHDTTKRFECKCSLCGGSVMRRRVS